MNKEVPKSVLEMSSCESTMEIVMKNIYTSCDPHNMNEVPAFEIIEFIRPYMLEDLSALETLRIMLDPYSKNECIDGEKFYKVMNEWAKKIASYSEEENSDGEFNRSASQLNDIDEKLLPYTQSTPRASFGQKLLSCQDLLNLSNVSHYNLSPTRQTKDNSIVGQEKTILEEELKQLQYELNKVLGEMGMLKAALAYSEEQNENLHDELEKLKTRLQSEPQVNGHLEENKNCLEDVKEEVNIGKKRIEELNKKLILYEKDNNHLNMYVQKLEKENTELEDRCEHLTKTEQILKKQLIDMKTELDMKEHELTSVSKINEDLRQKLHETRNEVDQLLNENELLDSKKQGLEKILTSRRYSLSSHYNTCLDEMSSYFSRGSTIPIYSSPLKNQSFSYNNATTHNNNNNNSPSLIQNVLSPFSPNSKGPKSSKMLYDVLRSSTPKGLGAGNAKGMRKAFSLNAMSTRSMPNIFCSERSSNFVQDQGSEADGALEPMPPDFALFVNGPYESLQTELFQVDPQFDHKDKNGTDVEYEEHIAALKSEIESLQNKIQNLLTENKILANESKTNGERLVDLDEKLMKILSEKRSLEERVSEILENKTEENRLEDKLNELKSELVRKDKEMKNKFDFESAYKSLEGEYGRKISLIDELQRQKDENNDTILNLTNINRNLKQSLKDSKIEIQETKEKLKSRETLSSNIEQTANKVQLNVEGKSTMMSELQKLNNDSKHKIDKLEKDLQDKTKQLGHLKDILKREEVIKNKMWSDNQDLTSSLNVLTDDYKKLLNDIEEHETIKKELKEDRDVALSKYNRELEKNGHLESELRKDLTDVGSKYRQLVDNNLHVLDELAYLKAELECVKDHHKLYKNELDKSLREYRNVLQLLSSKLKDLEFENNILRTDLSIEKQKFSKQSVCDDKIKAAEYEDSGFKNDAESETSSESSLMSFNCDKSALPTKNRTFEKQKLTIDRLKEKLDDLEMILTDERAKNDRLKQSLLAKESEIIRAEKTSSQSVIDDLKNQLAQQEDYYKHLCNASNEKIKELSIKVSRYDELYKNALTDLSQKESVLQRHFETSEYNKTVIENLTKSAQDLRTRHDALIADLGSKEISLKRAALENRNLKHLAARLENQVLDLRKKDEELTSLTSLVSDRERRLEALTAAAEEYERRLSVKDDLELEIEGLREKLARKENRDAVPMEDSVENDSTVDRIAGFVDVVSECCNDLNMAFTKFVEHWKSRLELDANFKKLPALKLCSSFEIGHVLSVIVDNVKIVILLFNILSSNDPNVMEENADSYVNYLSNAKVEVKEPKVIRKFTLRPAKLDARPVSPDSPGIIELEQQKIDEIDRENVHDSQNCGTFGPGDDGEQCGRTLPLLTFDLQLQDAFPHLSDSFLDKLGLHETSPKAKLSKDETERLFTTFAIQVALDSKDIKDRLQKQKDLCSQIHRKFVYLLKDVSVRLREHKCIGATDSINPVFVMLEDVRYQMQEMMQSVGQFGVLTCENRMTKCWNLVTNYMAIIRQNTEFWKEQSSPNRLSSIGSKSPTNSPAKCRKCEQLKASTDDNKKTKECSRYRSCYSRFTRALCWLSYVPLLFFVGVMLVHFQCKMNTVNKVCPMDDFIKVLSRTVGSPPY